jgi:hypothetical protein
MFAYRLNNFFPMEKTASQKRTNCEDHQFKQALTHHRRGEKIIFRIFLRESRRTQRENATIPADPGETEFVIFSSSKQENRKKNVFGPDRLPSVALQQQRKLKKKKKKIRRFLCLATSLLLRVSALASEKNQ